MGEDIERPLRHVEEPRLRGVELLAPQTNQYDDESIQEITRNFDNLEADQPETVQVAIVREKAGRLAVAMAVRGTHVELYGKVQSWLGLLGATDTQVGYEWSIGH